MLYTSFRFAAKVEFMPCVIYFVVQMLINSTKCVLLLFFYSEKGVMGRGGTSFVPNLCAFVTFHFRKRFVDANESIGVHLPLN